MKIRVVLTTALVATLAVVLSSTASANWTHKGKGELKENASVTLAGTVTLSTSAGNVACPTTIGATLTGSSSAGDVNSFTVSKASECDLTGSLAAICGTNGVTKVEKTGTWALAADENDITLSAIDVHYTLAGCLIPGFRLKGAATLSLDKSNAIGSATFSGTQTLYNSLGEESGSGELKGTLAMSPAGTYGTKTAATVETRWTDGNAHLGSDGKLTLTGNFSFSAMESSVTCPSTVKLLLESSTVEEEEPEGEVESFVVSEPAKCDVTGTLKTLCGTNSVASVEKTGAATLTATTEDITISGLTLDYKFSSCAVSSLRLEGTSTLSVSSPEAISSATFGGTLNVFNSGGEKTGTATVSGSPSASPAGTYQLVEDIPSTEETWNEEGEIHLEGELATNVKGSPVSNGPCEVTLQGSAYNVEGVAHADIEDVEVLLPCVVSPLPGCTIEEMDLQNFDWTLVFNKEDAGIEIHNIKLTNTYNTTCQAAYGLPPAIAVYGTATGEMDIENQCIVFNTDGDLTVPSGPPVHINGYVCLVEGSPTLHSW